MPVCINFAEHIQIPLFIMKHIILRRKSRARTFALAFLFCALVPLRAQVSYDTIRWWNLAKYEAETLSNLAADTKTGIPCTRAVPCSGMPTRSRPMVCR